MNLACSVYVLHSLREKPTRRSLDAEAHLSIRCDCIQRAHRILGGHVCTFVVRQHAYQPRYNFGVCVL
jgi:hypothetical protein